MGQGKRGTLLESNINETNKIYQQKNLALIKKQPTPIKVLKTKGVHILKGVYIQKGTVDYEGIYKGRAIAFEAKSTTNSTNFPLRNIPNHQLIYLQQAESMGALCFFLLEFRTLSRVYLVPFYIIQTYVNKALQGYRKSIPLYDCEYYGYKVTQREEIPLDYLPYVEKLLNS
ncbi:Holliday junction resolvase RecU [Bacillus subtilis]|nr:Holliday junction resolvase RecU [Bacillus subtilis]